MAQENKKIPELDNEMFKNIIETMGEAVWIWDKNERTIYANPNFCNMLEYKLEEIIWQESYIFRDDSWVSTVKDNNELRKEWKRSSYEWNLKTKTWKLVPVFARWTPLPGGWTSWIHTDLREIRAIQDANEKLDLQLKTILSLQKELNRQIEAVNNSAIVIETDKEWIINNVNGFYENLSGYTKDELVWTYYNLLSYDKYPDQFINDLNWTINWWKMWKWILKIITKSWKIFWTQTTITPFFNENEEIYKFVFISHDITELKNLLGFKDDFLNMATHELRTPLTAIKSYLSMVLDGDTWEIWAQTNDFLSKVYKSTERLISLVNDMLDLSKLESWKMKFFDENVYLNDIIDDTFGDFVALMREKNIDFNFNFDKKAYTSKVFVDKNRIKQILTNLIGNAYKFTPTNWSIKIQCSQEDNKIKIEVIDSWIWIPKDAQNKIFEKFEQVWNQQNIKWTWLGLNISQVILSHYNSILKVESEEWKWSNFYFFLPTLIENEWKS